MPAQTLQDLFLVELKDIYDSEHRLTDALSELAERTEQEDISSAFTEHESQTEQHIQRLEQVFDALGEEPQREECQASKGMIQETEHFYQEQEPSTEVGDRYAVTAAQKTERYEITAYENMLQWANEAGMDTDVTEALRQNLDEEIETLQRLQRLAEEYDYQTLMA